MTIYHENYIYFDKNNLNHITLYGTSVVVEDGRSCVVQLTSKTPLHIASSSTSKSSCGTKLQPWILESRVGQQINVSLLDFTTSSSDNTRDQGPEIPQCLTYGYVIDKSARKNISLCGGRKERESLVYLSKTNLLEMVLIPSMEDEDLLTFNMNYLVRFTGSYQQ